MSITRKRMEHDAQEQIIQHLKAIEFSNIYEDEIIAEGYTEQEQRELFDLILNADIHVSWKDAE